MRPGFLNSFRPSQVYVDPFDKGASIRESFEYDGAWPGTIPNGNYPYTFTGFATPAASEQESFEAAGGWPGT